MSKFLLAPAAKSDILEIWNYYAAEVGDSELADSGKMQVRVLTGSTTNGIVEVRWDLIHDGGKRYTNDSFNSTWTVRFPDPLTPGGANTP
jgi:hypothetical protein